MLHSTMYYMLRSETREKIREILKQNPSLSVTQISKMVGKSRTAVHYHIVKIRNEGLEIKNCSVCGSDLK